MKILLINPLVREWAQSNCFPSGLGYIATVLLQEGHDVVVMDFNADRENIIYPPLNYNPDMVGITGIITQYKAVKRLAKLFKERYPTTIVVAGGPLASSIPQLLLNKTYVDICIEGEGENIIKEITKDFNTLKDHKDTTLEYKIEKNINKFDFPSYNLFPMEKYIINPIAADNIRKWDDGIPYDKKLRRSLNIIGSRGCPYNCIYCYHNYMGQGWRMRSANNIIEEITLLKENYGIEYIHFTDDAFASSKKKIIEFCIIKNEDSFTRDIKWSCAGRANVVDEEMIKYMIDSGCEGVCYGLESGSQEILNIMKKKVTLQQYEYAIQLNKKYFKYEDYSFIVGSPGETDKTINESIDFCKRMDIVPTAIFYMTPYPGTPLFDSLVINGEIDFFDYNWMEMFVESLGEQGEQMIWNFTNYDNNVVLDWHNKFIKETNAWNKKKHKK